MSKLPKYCEHSSGQARVRLNGKVVYLGKYGSPESKRAYRDVCRKILAGDAEPIAEASVADVAARWMAVYAVRFGEDSEQYRKRKRAIVPLLSDWGGEPIAKVGPLRVKKTRERWIKAGKARSTINAYMALVKEMYRWGVENEHVKPETWQAVLAITNVSDEAKPAKVVEPVPIENVTKTLPKMRPMLQDMVRLQALTGMRSGNLTAMTPGQIDRASFPWVYRPSSHKTKHKKKELAVPLGPQAREILEPLLRGEDDLLFTTRVGNRFTSATYGTEIKKACIRAGVPHWHPHQLRHSLATAVRSKHGIEAAQVLLGHAKLDVTQIYAEKNLELARRIAEELG